MSLKKMENNMKSCKYYNYNKVNVNFIHDFLNDNIDNACWASANKYLKMNRSSACNSSNENAIHV